MLANEILTPLAVWEDFTINNELKEEVISQRSVRNIVYKEVYLKGRKTDKGEVKIYALISYDKRLEKMPAILILPNFSHEVNGALVKELAKKGYYAMIIDIRGRSDADRDDGSPIGEAEKEHIKKDKEAFKTSETNSENKSETSKNDNEVIRYTLYPEDIEYANYEIIKHDLQKIDQDVKGTCWYEWGCVAKYAYAYIKQLKNITTIGALGVRRGASVLWQLAATEPSLACAAFTFNAGWRAYRNYFKFAVNSEPDFSGESYKYLAGIEPQSYAMYVKCPSLLITPTNSLYFDADRATDTLARIKEEYYSGFDFSFGSYDVIGSEGYNNIEIFFNKYLKKEKGNLPEQPDISCELVSDGIEITVKPTKSKLKSLDVYCAEDTVNPAYRAWNRYAEFIRKNEKGYLFKYVTQPQTQIAFFFARATYENEYSVSSRITAKRINSVWLPKSKVNLIYSSTMGGSKNSIYPARVNAYTNGEYMMTDGSAEIKYKKGPMDIVGVTSNNGLISYKCNAECDKIREGAILHLDVFTKTDNVLKVLLECINPCGEVCEYIATKKLKGGDLWHSVCFSAFDFKSERGIQIKSFETVKCMMFNCEEEYLLNNVIWI